MKIIQPSVSIETKNWERMLQRIEEKGRVCYRSESEITADSAEKFVKNLVMTGHLSVLEHESVSVKFIVDRGVSHEIVRHRIASYSQESTRYCTYTEELIFIEPIFVRSVIPKRSAWEVPLEQCEIGYKRLLKEGCTAQEARSVLPTSLKTELWMTANLREWMHFFELRAAKAAHPQMRQVAIPLLRKMKELLPAVFDTIDYDRDFPAEDYAKVITVSPKHLQSAGGSDGKRDCQIRRNAGQESIGADDEKEA